MINAITNAIELTDEQLSQVVGGCGGHERRDNCGGDNWGSDRGGRRRHRNDGCGQYGWGHQSYESDFTEERHVHRSRSYGDDC